MNYRRFTGLLVMLALLILLLNACDNKDNAAPQAPAQHNANQHNATQPATDKPAALPDKAQLAALAAQSQGKSLQLLDLSELQLDGANALVLTFSIPLAVDQDFSRVAHVADEESGKLDGAWELSANLQELRFRHVEPDRKLIVSVDSGLLALNKTPLGESFRQTIKTRDIQPIVGFTSRGSLLPASAQGLPVMAMNVPDVDVNFFRVKPASLAQFVHDWQYDNALSGWGVNQRLKMMDLVYSGRFALNPPRNTYEKLLLPIKDIQALQQPGVYLAVMSPAGQYDYYHASTLFSISNIALSAHNYRDRLEVVSQQLSDGALQAAVAVTLLDEKGRQLAHAVTDSDGRASFRGVSKDAALLMAQKDGQTTLLDLQLPALDLAEFAISGDAGYDKQLFMFGPRDLYRPGETVIFNALLRDSDGKPLAAQPIRLEVVQPDGQVADSKQSLPQNGLYRLDYPLPADAATGTWHIRANTGDAQPRQWDFQVEDFMPERVALSLKAHTSPLTPQEDVTFQANGRYLYGAPASGNSVQGQFFLRPLRDAVATLPGFRFGDVTEENLRRSLDEEQITLNDQGNGELRQQTQWQEVRSPVQVILQASLLESAGRPVTRRVRQAIWPSAALPGIRPLFAKEKRYDYRTDSYSDVAVVDAHSQAKFDIVYVNAQGQKLAVSGLRAQLIYERRNAYWDWSADDGWQLRYQQKDLPQSEQILDLAAGQTGQVSFRVDRGSYRLEVHTPDNQVSSVRFSAGYRWQDNGDGGGAQRPDQVMLTLDKATYSPGDTVKLHIAAPAAGKGYVMLESASQPLWWQPVDVPATGLDLSVPLDKHWQRHDLYFSALVVRGDDASQSATSKRAVGILYLPIADASRHLTLTLDAPAKVRPNQPLAVNIKAATPQGEIPRQIQVLVSAVDSGVLSITDYVTPDPWQAFLGRKRYAADIYDVYGKLIEGQGRLASLRFGGDEDTLNRGGKPPVNHVQIIAEQALPVTLNDQGEGTVSLPIGDFNGELRIMAQAWTDDRFASSERKVVVAAPLVSELNMPRFLAGGDQARLALDLTNLTATPQTLHVQLEAHGLVRLEKPQAQTLSLAAGERQTLFVPVRALTGFGDGDISATVSGLQLPGETAPAPYSKHWKIGVRPPYPAQTLSRGGTLMPGQSLSSAKAQWADFVPETLNGRLLLSGSPPLNQASYIRQLQAYPYACLEQTASRLYPALYSNAEQLKALGIGTDSDQQRRVAINQGIAHILQMQKANGGFALWDRQGAEEYWLTAYATDFLLQASERGYPVPAQALTNASNRLLRYLQEPGMLLIRYSTDADASQFAVQAYAGLVLARQQKAPLGALRELWQRHRQAASALPVAQLAVALKLMGDAPLSEQALKLASTLPPRKENSWLGDYGSPLRDNALMLALLENHQLMTPSADDHLLQQVSEQAFSKPQRSTQENNALFLAAHALQPASAAWQATTSLPARTLKGDSAQTYALSASQLSQLHISNSGSTPLWLRVDSSGYTAKPPPPVAKVLHITRRILATDGSEKNLNDLHSGELVLVQLTVRADENVPDALVVDLLPAGFELENQNLLNSSASLNDSGSAVKPLLDEMQRANIQHLEYRDDRFVAAVSVDQWQTVTLVYLARAVTPGVYQLPVPQVESMYIPQWRASGVADGTITIAAP